MACSNCNNNSVKCGCADTYLTSPLPCPTPVDCPEAQPCSEIFDAGCVVYTGDDILCDTDVVVAQNASVAQAIEDVVTYFCANGPVPLLTAGLQCIETPAGTIAPIGTPITEALQSVVNTFCPVLPEYTIYAALLTQSGVADPIPTELGTSTMGSIVWTRLGIGDYLGTLAAAFDVNTTAIIIGSNTMQEGVNYIAYAIDSNTIALKTSYTNLAGHTYDPQDEWLFRTFIEVRTY